MMEGVELVSSVGFPIAAFLLMWRFATTSLKENTKAITELHTLIKAKLK